MDALALACRATRPISCLMSLASHYTKNTTKILDLSIYVSDLLRFDVYMGMCGLLSEGPFQSDALLVPEGCLFDHIHNASRCWPFVRWNQTGAAACQERGMQMRSFAMLLPCGISLFSGVEFVCCPKHFKSE